MMKRCWVNTDCRTVLVIGSGGREHAIAQKLADSPSVARVIVSPGNGGTEKGTVFNNKIESILWVVAADLVISQIDLPVCKAA